MRTVFLSEQTVVDPDRCDHGIYRRLGSLIEILSGISDVEGLIIVHHQDPAATVERYCVNLSRRWGVKIRCISGSQRPPFRRIVEADKGMLSSVQETAVSPAQINQYVRAYDVILA